MLLTLVRETITAHLSGTSLPPLPRIPDEPTEFGGAFVTLRNKGRLRGCIGRFDPPGGLAETVRDMAVAALCDPRFRQFPVTQAEVPQLHLEISVLSRMTRTDDPLSLVPGVHGIYVRRGGSAGCFLPQVAREQKWDREMFLSRCCSDKAGLAADAWRDPATEVYLFTCEVLEESERERTGESDSGGP